MGTWKYSATVPCYRQYRIGMVYFYTGTLAQDYAHVGGEEGAVRLAIHTQ